MSAPESPALGTMAYQLATALDAYVHDVDSLLHARFDPELYRRVGQRMEDMRQCAASLPTLSGTWVEVLIRHAELTHGLWRAGQPGAPEELPQLRSQLHDAVQRLARQCMMLLPAA